MKYIISICLFLSMSSFSFAEGSAKGGDDFRHTASEYQQLASKYNSKGKSEIANLYTRMSEIKIDAANKADEGRWDDIDWTEYFQIEEKIAYLKSQK